MGEANFARVLSLYYKRVSPSAHEIAIEHRIDELYTAQSSNILRQAEKV